MRGVDPDADAAVLSELRRHAAEVVGEELRDARSAVLIDFPRHPNFGDSLIWLGEEALLRHLGVRVAFRTSLYDYERRDVASALSDDTMILMHGGGNLGDLYPHHDDARLKVIRDFPGIPKLVLPQSLYAAEPGRWRDRAQLYAESHNVRVLLRERASLERAARLLPGSAIRFCPDLALWAPIRPAARAGRGPPALLRPASLRRWLQSALLAGYGRLNCRSALRQLAPRRAVATDRLHAHIACVLLGIPHAVTDNTYGKIAAVFEYTGAFSTAHWAPTLAEARQLAERLAADYVPRPSGPGRRA